MRLICHIDFVNVIDLFNAIA